MATTSWKGFSKSSSGCAYGKTSASSRLIRRARRTRAVGDSSPGGWTTALAGAVPLRRAVAFLGATVTFLAAGAFFTAAPFEAFCAADVLEAAFLAEAVSFAEGAFFPSGVSFAEAAVLTEAAFFAETAVFADAAPFAEAVCFADAAFFADPVFLADAVFFTGSVLFSFAVFLPPSGLCSPTAELRRTTTRAAPSACALTGDLDTRPA